MAILKHSCNSLSFTEETETANVWHGGKQSALPGHISVYSGDSRLSGSCYLFEIEQGQWYDGNIGMGRSELRSESFFGILPTKEGWVAFSIKILTTDTGTEEGVMFQWWDSGSPSVSGRWDFETNNLILVIWDEEDRDEHIICNLGDGAWHDIKIEFKLSEDSSGFINVWHNLELVVAITGRNLYGDLEDGPFKIGNYAASFGESDLPNRVHLLDEIAFADASYTPAEIFEQLDPEGRKALSGIDYPANEGPDYYVSNTGSDSNDGSFNEPFGTLSKINGMDLEPGDQIHLDADSVFREDLSIPTTGDGTSVERIKVQSYGTGKSKITGAIPVDNWTLTSTPNIYESVDAAYPAHISGLMIGADIAKKGRLPKTGHLEYQTYTSSSITSNQLPDIDYSGGGVEAVIEKTQWVHDTVVVSGRSGNTLNYTGGSSYSGGANKWFFIQNALECLTEQGDWMYSPSEKKLFIYSTVNPNSLDIEVQTEEYAVHGDGNAYTDYENLQIEGSSQMGVRIHVAGYARILDNIIKNHGGTGVAFLTASNGVIEENLVEWCLNKGIDVYNESNNTLISKNTVKNIATILGAAGNGDGNGIGIRGFGSGITYQLNRLENIGYTGIYFRGDNTTITRNFIEKYCIRKHDGGGLYCYGGQKDTATYENQVIHRNIIQNGGLTPMDAAYGIYIDDNSEDITITENLFIRSGRAAYFNHNSHEILFNNNIIFGCEKAIQFAENGDNELIRNNEVHDNIIVVLSKNAVALSAFTEANDVALFGSFSGNTYLVASNHQIVFNLRYVISGKDHFECLSWGQWQALGFDLDSTVQYLDVPEYEILSEGSNLFTGPPSAYLEGGSTSITIDDTLFPGATKCVVTSAGSVTTRIELRPGSVGAVDASKDYILRFKAAATSGHQSMVIYVRETGTPYRRLCPDVFAYTGDEMQEFEFLFSDLVASDNASILIEHQSHQGDFYIQDYEFREVSVSKTDYDQHLKVIYNDSEVTDTIAISGSWKDLDDNLVEELELESFESRLILKSEEEPPDEPPIAVITADTESGDAPLTVAFTGDQSVDDAGIVAYLWDFGDGESSTDQNPTHEFAEPGEYTVSLTVEDTAGLTDTDTITITVNEPNQPPVAVIGVDRTSGTAPMLVQFTGSGSTDDIGIVSYAWDFGDGGTSAEADPTHVFAAGHYTVTLTVSDAEGLTAVDTVTISASPQEGPPPFITVSGRFRIVESE